MGYGLIIALLEVIGVIGRRFTTRQAFLRFADNRIRIESMPNPYTV